MERAKSKVRSEKYERTLTRVVRANIHPDRVDEAMKLMQAEALALSKRDARKIARKTSRAIEWAEKVMGKYKDHPYWTKGTGEAPPPEVTQQQAPPERQPLTTGRPKVQGSPQAPQGGGQDATYYKGKTTRPGRPDSMNQQELTEFREFTMRNGAGPRA